MNEYTVILLWPDYLADNFGHDIYVAYVEANTPASAAETAQQSAIAIDGLDMVPDPYDFHVLAVFEGHHPDVKDPV